MTPSATDWPGGGMTTMVATQGVAHDAGWSLNPTRTVRLAPCLTFFFFFFYFTRRRFMATTPVLTCLVAVFGCHREFLGHLTTSKCIITRWAVIGKQGPNIVVKK